jgi:hypothetical protein
MGSCPVAEAELQSGLIQLAIQLAKAANAEPSRPGCQGEIAAYNERQARIGASA